VSTGFVVHDIRGVQRSAGPLEYTRCLGKKKLAALYNSDCGTVFPTRKSAHAAIRVAIRNLKRSSFGSEQGRSVYSQWNPMYQVKKLKKLEVKCGE
jgi:hypothetical protein